MPTHSASAPQFPPQIKFIVGNEACERFSFYGMKSILTVFMTGALLMPEPEAKETYHLFVAACYFLPLLGAFISDRLLGKYRTILYLSIVYCLGHLTLALFENSRQGFMLGLGLIALGAGGIKPCVSAHVGDQFTAKNESLLTKVFDLFYWSINFGAFFSTILVPWTLAKYGSQWAFGIPGILMAMATFVFWMGRKRYVHVPPTPASSGSFAAIVLTALTQLGRWRPGTRFLALASKKYKADQIEAAQSVLDIFKVFFFVSIFWSLFDQQGSSWVLQAQKMDLNLWGMQLEASQIQALNPILVMLMIPVFGFGIYPMVEKLGIRVTPLRKMTVGMLLAGFSFLAVGLTQTAIDGGARLSVAWQIIPYVIITASEIMISITGLEFAYTQAPRSMKSTIMSFWLLTVFFGNMLAATIARVNYFKGAMEFYSYFVLTGVLALIFAWLASRYKVRNYLEKA